MNALSHAGTPEECASGLFGHLKSFAKFETNGGISARLLAEENAVCRGMLRFYSNASCD
jgi:hypothetical protein